MQDSSNKNFPLLYDSSTFCSNFVMPIEKPLLVKLVHWLSEIELFDTSSSSIFLYSNLTKYLSMKAGLLLAVGIGGWNGRCSGCAGRMSMGIGQRKGLK